MTVRRPPRRAAGFSLVELVIVVAILTVLVGASVPVVGSRLKSSRDARRLQDVQTLVKAIDEYLYDHGTLPAHVGESDHSGWDTSLDGSFVDALVRGGYLREHVADPLNTAAYHYRYHVYDAGFDGFATRFYVVGILNFETDAFRSKKGWWKGNRRDWTDEFAFVMGGLEQ